MATEIDSLQIEMNAKATKANDAIDRLVKKLDILSTSLGKINGSSLNGLSNGVQRLGNAMQSMNNIRTTDFTRLANNLTRLGNINVSSLNSSASSISHLTKAFNGLGTVSSNAQQIGVLVNSLSRLGGASVQRAITNLPQLATAMNNLLTTLSKAPRVSQNVIDMTNALANLASQGNRVGSASNSIAKCLNRASNSATRAKKSFGGLASTIGKFYATFFIVIRGLKGLWSSIESTSDYIEAYNYFDVALGKIGKDWGHQYEEYGYDNAEEYAESFSKRLSENLKSLSGVNLEIDVEGKGLLSETGLKNLGLNIQEVTQYASQLASVTNSVGQTGEVSLAAASTFTKLGADMSSLFNVDYSSVMNNLQSGLIGQSRALYKYGIDITNATLQTYAYELGLSKAVSEMTQAEKMQLRMIAILDQSKVAWGDLANTINSPSNMIRQFTNNIKEAGMILGQLFIPLLQKVLPIINGVVIAIKRLLVSIAEFFGIKIDLGSFGQGYSDLAEDIGGVSDSLDNVASSAKKAKAGLRAFDELKTINMPDTSSANSGIPGGSGIDLTDEILNATSEYEKAWKEAYDRMEDVSGQWADKFEKIFAPVKKLFKDISIGDWFAVGQDVNTIATGILDFFINAIEKVDWKEVGNNIGEFIQGLDWLEIIKKAFELKFKIWEAIAEVWFGSFKAAPIETTVLTAIGLLKFTGASKIIASKLFGGLTPQAMGSSLGSKVFSSLSSTWTSLGGLGGILTADLGTIMASGSATAIGMTLATGIIAGIAAGFVGFEIGKFIGKSVTPEEFTEYYDNFKFFGDGGFFNEISDDWGITMQASLDMADDLGGGPLTSFLKSLDKYGEKTDLYTNKMVEAGLYTVQMGTVWNENVLSTFEKAGKKLDDGIVNMNLKADSGLSELGSMMKKKTNPITKDWEISMDLLSKTTSIALDETNSKTSKGIDSLVDTVSKGMKVLSTETKNKTKIVNAGLELMKKTWGKGMDSIVEKTKNGMESTNSVMKIKSSAMQTIWKSNNSFMESSLKNTIDKSSKLITDGMSTMNREIENGTTSMIAKLSQSTVSMGTEMVSQLGAVKNSMSGIKNDMESMWVGVADVINKGVSQSTRAMLVKTTGGMNAIIEGFEGLLKMVSQGTNSIITGINTSLGKYTSSTVKSFNPLTKLGRITIPAFAGGGYVPNTYSMFMAGENGIPEILGTVGGKTAVAGGVEITGIKDAIYSTSKQELQLMQEQNSLLRALLEKETGISSDALFKSVKQSASDYTKRTGRPAF